MVGKLWRCIESIFHVVPDTLTIVGGGQNLRMEQWSQVVAAFQAILELYEVAWLI